MSHHHHHHESVSPGAGAWLMALLFMRNRQNAEKAQSDALRRAEERDELVLMTEHPKAYEILQQRRAAEAARARQTKGIAWIIVLALFGYAAYCVHNSPDTPPPVTSSVPDSGTAPTWTAPAAAPDTTAPAAPSTSPSSDRVGSVNMDTDVLDASGAVIQRIHEDRMVHILQIASDGRMRIRLHDGDEGWIAAGTATDVGPWDGSVPQRKGSP